MDFGKKKFLLLMLIICACIFSPIKKIQAAGLAVKPKEIHIVAEYGEKITQNIFVANIFNSPLVYRVYPDNYEGIISASPKDFQLLPGESQIVNVTIIAKSLKQKSTNISIVAQPQEGSGVKVNFGVKIPFTLEIHIDYILWLQVLIICILVMCIIFSLIKRFIL